MSNTDVNTLDEDLPNTYASQSHISLGHPVIVHLDLLPVPPDPGMEYWGILVLTPVGSRFEIYDSHTEFRDNSFSISNRYCVAFLYWDPTLQLWEDARGV